MTNPVNAGADIEKELLVKHGWRKAHDGTIRRKNGDYLVATGEYRAALLAEAGERAKLEALKSRHEGRMFRLQDGPAIPWEIIAPHACQAESNHCGQTLERLQQRGGLGVQEFWYVMHDQKWGQPRKVSDDEARAYANELVSIFAKQREQIAAAELRASTEAERARGLEAQLETVRQALAKVEDDCRYYSAKGDKNYVTPATRDAVRAALSQLPTPARPGKERKAEA